MTLRPGARLGAFELDGPIGAGGMGEVYRARDTRLDRTVAIKVLPEHLASDPALRERFEREARAVSSLNHPHICTLHDVGDHEGVHFLVMEYLDGETLAARLKKGALPLAKALEIAAQIADALSAAHREGVVHRDLKPGNVMLTRSGVKLLDFGLATQRRQPVAEANSHSGSGAPTQAKPLTGAGTILGTIQYMAPEQLEAKEVDARADLFGLGAILFEMVTGRKAFEGESQASLISAIMSTEPPQVSELETLSPPALDRIVGSCLAKDPAHRWHSAHDLKTELQWLATSSGAGYTTERTTSVWRWGAAGLALGLAATVFALLYGRSPSPPASETLHLDIKIPPTDTLALVHGRPGVAISPDGSRLVYVASRDDGPTQLFLRELGGFEATPIPGTEGAQYPFFSPDGEWITFLSELSIRRVSARSGANVVVAPFQVDSYGGFSYAGGDWLPNGDIVLGNWNAPLRRIATADGTVEDVTELGPPPERGHAWPDVLPDGKTILFTAWGGGDKASAVIVAQSLETGERRQILNSIYARYVPSGHLVYVLENNLMAVPFDLTHLTLTGPAVPVVSGIRITPAWSADLALSERGQLVYVTSSSLGNRFVEIRGRRTLRVDTYGSVRSSPSGGQLALNLQRDGSEAWLHDIARNTLTPLSQGTDTHSAIWSSDGERLVFTSIVDGVHNLHWWSLDGNADEPVERLSHSPHHQIPGSASPDGQFVAYTEFVDGQRAWDLFLLPLQSPNEPRPFVTTPGSQYAPMFSPDGKWLAYVSDESGESAVYVQPFPGPGPKTRISESSGSQPVWAPDGRTLHYLATNGRIVSVPLHFDPDIRPGASEVRYPGRVASANFEENSYDVLPDGSFVVLRDDPASRDRVDIRFVTGWFEELKRLAPAEE